MKVQQRSAFLAAEMHTHTGWATINAYQPIPARTKKKTRTNTCVAPRIKKVR